MRTFLSILFFVGGLMAAFGLFVWTRAPAVTQELVAALLLGFGLLLMAVTGGTALVEDRLDAIRAELSRRPS